MNPKVSVVIPICNVEKYLRQCLDSAVKQTLKDIEIICVDDGSKDNSLSIIQEYADLDNRVKVLAKPNTGYGNSVNRGIAMATGTYIAILESDDFISADMYEELWNLSEDGSVDVVKSNFYNYYDNPETDVAEFADIDRDNMPDVETSFTLREYPEILWGHPSIWSAIYRREFLTSNNIHFLEAPGGGWVDNPFFFETLCAAEKIRWTKKCFYHYRKTNTNSSSNKQTDLTIPLVRMIQNLEVMNRYGYHDEEIQKYLYARALMYWQGNREERCFEQQRDSLVPLTQKLFLSMNQKVFVDDFNVTDQIKYFKNISPLQNMVECSGKLLIYNWVPFDNPGRVGGGVNLYCYNLVSTILRNRPDIQVYFLSSGWAYDANTTECYIRHIDNVFGDRCRTFEIVNSPIPADQFMLLNNTSFAIQNPVLRDCFDRFLVDYGPFKAVHFNNLEGLSLDVLELKQSHTDTLFVYSMHNYVPVCPTGFYFKRGNKCNCDPNHSLEDCIACTNVGRKSNISKLMYERAEIGAQFSRYPADETKPDKQKWLSHFKFTALDTVDAKADLNDYCRASVSAINSYVDYVLAVSGRVREIAIDNGISESKTLVSYIGTRIADFQLGKSVAPKSDYFKIGFLGNNYNFVEKGYPFLMEALEALDDDIAAKVDLMLTTTNGDIKEMKRRLKKFHSVEVIHGYTHADLRKLLKDVHLGVIPVLWEDNLPQIAIEMVAMGVPVLCSSFGGASELCSSDLFKFKGGDVADFTDHLVYLINNPDKLNDYWANHTGLTTMDMHWAELEKLFGFPKCPDVVITAEQYARLVQENDFLYRHVDNNGEADAIKRSFSYKLARALTFIPRKCYSLAWCLKHQTLKYTLGRIRDYILLRG